MRIKYVTCCYPECKEDYIYLSKYSKTKYPIFNHIINLYVYQYVSISWWDEWDSQENNYLYLTDKGIIYELLNKNNMNQFYFSNQFNSLINYYDIHKSNYKYKNELTIETNKNIFGHNRHFTIYKKFLRNLSNMLKGE